MNARALGKSGIDVSEIGLGTNAVGGHNLYENLDEDAGVDLVRRAVDVGINFIDTADVYGLGRSEELTGTALDGIRDRVVLATKGANVFGDGKRGGVRNDPAYLREALEASLKRLGTDHVDLYYIHKHDGTTPIDEAFGGLLRLKEEGKIRAAGVSNFSLDQLKEAEKAGPVDAIQNEYHLFNRGVEADILPYCEKRGIAFVPWGPLAFGLLGGKYTREFRLTESDWRNRVPLFSEDHYGTVMDAVEALKEIAAEKGVPLSHVAIRWMLRSPAVASVIAGAKRADQVEQNAAAASVELSEDEIARIDAIADRVNAYCPASRITDRK